ncbi:Nitrogenase molybdenum-iron protein alpha chain [bioreactor metagenome]|jgi:nitrogenase molybdenum-iron cofactor biosynthesis protein NifE|uniref:Nitrogenase iron-molybdenum cofactor biosynthesis protein NifE n=2 Tax=root TaxID=1 RepID=A0A212KJG5_9BACT|nr:nitrogenase iron-molybdenum cofactor biosynthesis protein NifE [Desulfovibrio desulfuricans]MBD8895221.1 nitrogenase iron-molybdenum cofactor biosynthesis protein NifE [Desulfovibrio desulfuricans]MCB6540915.1 nitrogenase iron-molybdenum cofactor biosynthesis protein NifE [Desulfovibrio desulfuricans]MCB6551997.1 nitrogenase iron-molybdenum cofactor biosynthesis protein NifE [Desulfovibrio desulfuricans]MCB6563839.1 nitrogenase iron-molybdenum cofactor biosynthesis protein NifE [Desulfovibri
MAMEILEERRTSIKEKGNKGGGCCSGDGLRCDTASVAGSVSQRACVYCGARVVLNPITDAFHIVHGPIGCASYTWDIRGSLTSGSELFRNSFSTDLQEKDIVFGGAEKLTRAIDEAVANYAPKLIFVYATCIVGVIGDDVEAVCRNAEKKHGIRVIAVKAPGFSGTKSTGYRMACNALVQLMEPHKEQPKIKGVNILGDYNLAGEMWIIRNYLREMGIPIVATLTGDAAYETLIKAPAAQLNIVQCAGSMMYLAHRMEDEMGVPWMRASFFGVEDTSTALRQVAERLNDDYAKRKAEALISERGAKAEAFLEQYKPHFVGKKAAIFVGGGFKAISLIRQFNEMGIETVVVGTQTGKPEDYEIISSLVNPGTVILDDANPAELETFMKQKGADILVGGVKERPLAYKLGIAFCDHNHERKHALGGFEGVENFTREVNLSINSPVWQFTRSSASFAEATQAQASLVREALAARAAHF